MEVVHSTVFLLVRLLVGTCIFSAFAIYQGSGMNLTRRAWFLIPFRILLFAAFWCVLSFVSFFLTYTGGTIDFIRLKEVIANIISLVIVLAIMYIEKKRLK